MGNLVVVNFTCPFLRQPLRPTPPPRQKPILQSLSPTFFSPICEKRKSERVSPPPPYFCRFAAPPETTLDVPAEMLLLTFLAIRHRGRREVGREERTETHRPLTQGGNGEGRSREAGWEGNHVSVRKTDIQTGCLLCRQDCWGRRPFTKPYHKRKGGRVWAAAASPSAGDQGKRVTLLAVIPYIIHTASRGFGRGWALYDN
ncbi:hypothetical protein QBC33DRAFT_60730 [Phialemonium atrogriseum]|uniref:Uncharacterized protein n=1 Tax=Phialemonium atrogriseum TaxID=1093897 RepID=A0AAJ0FLZ5_9PEZI|nr:uncharacterized protein QBC33DRAFT_60730 [Phialemonium atrogriseum]KAK1767848.1 hypothetical protein QBC33DRAFT_60730 [Phialemonium atrogriseum]